MGRGRRCGVAASSRCSVEALLSSLAAPAEGAGAGAATRRFTRSSPVQSIKRWEKPTTSVEGEEQYQKAAWTSGEGSKKGVQEESKLFPSLFSISQIEWMMETDRGETRQGLWWPSDYGPSFLDSTGLDPYHKSLLRLRHWQRLRCSRLSPSRYACQLEERSGGKSRHHIGAACEKEKQTRGWQTTGQKKIGEREERRENNSKGRHQNRHREEWNEQWGETWWRSKSKHSEKRQIEKEKAKQKTKKLKEKAAAKHIRFNIQFKMQNSHLAWPVISWLYSWYSFFKYRCVKHCDEISENLLNSGHGLILPLCSFLAALPLFQLPAFVRYQLTRSSIAEHPISCKSASCSMTVAMRQIRHRIEHSPCSCFRSEGVRWAKTLRRVWLKRKFQCSHHERGWVEEAAAGKMERRKEEEEEEERGHDDDDAHKIAKRENSSEKEHGRRDSDVQGSSIGIIISSLFLSVLSFLPGCLLHTVNHLLRMLLPASQNYQRRGFATLLFRIEIYGFVVPLPVDWQTKMDLPPLEPHEQHHEHHHCLLLRLDFAFLDFVWVQSDSSESIEWIRNCLCIKS